jgi:hypothetical protein
VCRSFDHHCIERHRARGNRTDKECPKCREPFTQFTRALEYKQLIRETVSVACANDGCGEVMPLDSYNDHVIKTCPHSRYGCIGVPAVGGVHVFTLGGLVGFAAH